MNLFHLATEQRQLDAHLEETPDNQELVLAVTAELGELAQEMKQEWCWWPRDNIRPYSREAVLGELIDVLHFLLLGYNLKNEVPTAYHQAHIQNVVLAGRLDHMTAMSELPSDILRMARQNRYEYALAAWYDLALSLRFTDQDIYEGYNRSVEKNMRRWGDASLL